MELQRSLRLIEENVAGPPAHAPEIFLPPGVQFDLSEYSGPFNIIGHSMVSCRTHTQLGQLDLGHYAPEAGWGLGRPHLCATV